MMRLSTTPGQKKRYARLSDPPNGALKETNSQRGYKIRPVEKQIDMLCTHYPQLSSKLTYQFKEDTLRDLVLPKGAQGWFAIPRWEKLAVSYNKAVELITDAIASRHNFYNYRDGMLGPEYLREHNQSALMLWTIGKQQSGDILIIPAQFGQRHAGRSVSQARATFTANEFGLGAVTVGSMLLTHPDRLRTETDLFVDCPGDDYDANAGDRFDEAPIFDFVVDGIRFGSSCIQDNSIVSGSASGFLTQ